MHHDDPAEHIRKRMAELRRELDVDMGKVSRSARAMTDWTFYVRRFPWAVAGVAAVAGYLLIPKRKATNSADPEALADLIKNRKVHVEASTGQIQGILKGLLMTGVSLAAKAALAHVMQNFQQPKPNSAHDEPRTPAPSPLEEPWPQ